MNDNIYGFKASTLNGKEVSLSDYRGKTVIAVNTASKCGLTPQYKGLEELYKKYKDEGLVILGFPCDQFANQEPGDSDSIKETCYINYGVTFPMFSKIKVNGPDADPLFKFLTESLPGLGGKKVKWNFTKFLINSDGVPVKRFAPTVKPAALEKRIRKELGL